MSNSGSNWAVLTTPQGKGTLFLKTMSGVEALSELFHLKLEVFAPKETAIAFDDLLGKSVTLSLPAKWKEHRHFNGIVRRFGEVGEDDKFRYYQMEVAPKAWLLTQNCDYRVFQQKTVPQILEKLLAPLSVRVELTRQYETHNYRVQYRESDFTFASRLMEQEGIYYYFEHTDSDHVLVLADASPNSRDCFSSPLKYSTEQEGVLREPRVTRWRKFQELSIASYAARDFSFEMPQNTIESSTSAGAAIPIGSATHKFPAPGKGAAVFDYTAYHSDRIDSVGPGGEDQSSQLPRLFDWNRNTVQLRMEERLANSFQIEGVSDAVELYPGGLFELTGHPQANDKYLVVRLEHHVEVANESINWNEGTRYSNTLSCLPALMPYRPPLRTPVPAVQGAQTAEVVGPQGEEIFTDKYGRVKVQFPWDRYGPRDSSSSCWLRVAHAWAGTNFGWISTPRIGQEVLVGFLEGNPDAPIIVGSVYNAKQVPPFDLPTSKTVTGLKTRSRFGQPGDFHGLAFDDTKNSELVQLRSQKDMITETKGNHRFNTAGDHSEMVSGNRIQFQGMDLSFLSTPPKGSSASHAPSPSGSGQGSSGSGGDSGSSDDSSGSSSSSGSSTGGASTNSVWSTSLSSAGIPAVSYSSSLGLSTSVTAGLSQSYSLGMAQGASIDPLAMFPSLAAGSTVGPLLAGYESLFTPSFSLSAGGSCSANLKSTSISIGAQRTISIEADAVTPLTTGFCTVYGLGGLTYQVVPRLLVGNGESNSKLVLTLGILTAAQTVSQAVICTSAVAASKGSEAKFWAMLATEYTKRSESWVNTATPNAASIAVTNTTEVGKQILGIMASVTTFASLFCEYAASTTSVAMSALLSKNITTVDALLTAAQASGLSPQKQGYLAEGDDIKLIQKGAFLRTSIDATAQNQSQLLLDPAKGASLDSSTTVTLSTKGSVVQLNGTTTTIATQEAGILYLAAGLNNVTLNSSGVTLDASSTASACAAVWQPALAQIKCGLLAPAQASWENGKLSLSVTKAGVNPSVTISDSSVVLSVENTTLTLTSGGVAIKGNVTITGNLSTTGTCNVG